MRQFLKEVAIDLVNRFGDNLKDLAIIFNNKRPEVYIKQYFAEILKKPVWSPSFFTIQDFFKQGSLLLEADKISQVVLLHDCYTKLLSEKGLKPLRIDRFFPIAETILSDFAQIDYDLVDPHAIYQEIHDLAEIEKRFQFLTEEQISFLESFWKSFNQYGQEQIREKFIQLWKIMPQLYADFHASLYEQGKITTAGMYRRAVTLQEENERLTAPYKQLIFVGFNALNNAEGSLFKHWQEEEKALFYFDADAYYIQDRLQEAGLFIRKNRDQWHLKNALGPFPDQLNAKTTNINLFEAAGFSAQAKILDTILPNDTAEGPIAVLLADETLLVPVLQSIPNALTINITMGFPMNQSPLFGLVDIWLRCQASYHLNNTYSIAYGEIESFLIHPLVDIPLADKKDLQQKIRAHNYVNVPYTTLDPSTTVSRFFEKQDTALSLIKSLEGILKTLFSNRKEDGQLTLIEASLFAATLQELNHLYDGIQAHLSLQRADLPFIIALIRKHINQINAAIEGDPLQGVQIMGLLESRNLDFKEIYVLGANDGILPKRSFGMTFIPDAIRRAYGLPVLENQEALSAYLFYRLLHRTERLHIVYNNQVNESSTGEVTRFVKQLAFESNFRFTVLKQQQETKIAKLPPALSIPKSGLVAETLEKYLDGGPHKISATALTNYIQSPLLFFLKNMAQIREPDLLIEDFQVNKIGSILHEVMQWFYEELKMEHSLITADRIRNKQKDLSSLCLKALSKTFYNDKTFLSFEKTNSIEKIILQIVADYAQIILRKDIETCPFHIIELENNEDYVIDFPITVHGKERKVRLQGIIDRIDEKNGKIRIVDYKTGGDVLAFARSNDELFNAAHPKFNKALIQTLFYTFIYEQKRNQQNVEPHLYAVRRLNEEGTLFHSDKQNLEGNRLTEVKLLFVEKLREILEELFDTTIPFQHHPDVDIPYNELYQEFFNGAFANDTETEI